MTAALLGFLGVIAGVLLSGGMQMLMAWSERRRAGRVAALLLYDRAALALVALDEAYRLKRWSATVEWHAPLVEWERQRVPLTNAMRPTQFRNLSVAFGLLAQLDIWRAEDLASPDASSFALTELLYTEVSGAIAEAGLLLYEASFAWRDRRRGEPSTPSLRIASRTP